MKITVILTAGMLLAAIPGIADNLVTNGDFETGDFTGWTVLYNDGYTFVSTSTAESGIYSADFGTVGRDAEIEQTITDVVGQDYTFSFYYASTGTTPHDFSAQWNGATLISFVNTPAQEFTLYSFDVVGTGSDTISFFGHNDPEYDYLDDVRVTPEPSSTWLGVGLVFAALLKLRRRSADRAV